MSEPIAVIEPAGPQGMVSLRADLSDKAVAQAVTAATGCAMPGPRRIVAAGGRVLGVTARGASLRDAQKAAYAMVDGISWPEGFCRRDIGWRAL